jgi:hypothetical protein
MRAMRFIASWAEAPNSRSSGHPEDAACFQVRFSDAAGKRGQYDLAFRNYRRELGKHYGKFMLIETPAPVRLRAAEILPDLLTAIAHNVQGPKTLAKESARSLKAAMKALSRLEKKSTAQPKAAASQPKTTAPPQ